MAFARESLKKGWSEIYNDISPVSWQISSYVSGGCLPEFETMRNYEIDILTWLWSLTTGGRLWRQIPVVKDRWFWMDARLLELIASQKDTPINFLKPDSILGWETKIDTLFKDDTIFKREAKNNTQTFLKSLSLYSKE